VKIIVTILIMGLVLLAVTFSQQNPDEVTIRYFGFIPTYKVPAYLLIIASFFTGVIVAGLIGIIERFRLTMRVSKLKKEIKNLENDLYECRKQVLAEGAKATPPLSDHDLL
jgi:uncharacterized membrane protein YciS (DUF1049 family)